MTHFCPDLKSLCTLRCEQCLLSILKQTGYISLHCEGQSPHQKAANTPSPFTQVCQACCTAWPSTLRAYALCVQAETLPVQRKPRAELILTWDRIRLNGIRVTCDYSVMTRIRSSVYNSRSRPNISINEIILTVPFIEMFVAKEWNHLCEHSLNCSEHNNGIFCTRIRVYFSCK